MAQSQYADPNGGTIPDSWNDALDAQQEVVTQTTDLPFNTNFGHGNYDKPELYQQNRNFQKATVAAEMFDTVLRKRAIEETKVKLALEGITFWDDDGNQVVQYDPIDSAKKNCGDEDGAISNVTFREEHRSKDIRIYGNRIWRRIDDTDRVLSQKQVAAIMQKTGHDPNWMNFYAQVLVFFHEATRSVDAELLRDFLTGIKELRGVGDGETATTLLGGRKK